MQVNLQRQSNITPKISAHTHLHGQHDFNRHPLAPLGVWVHVYISPTKRKTWSVKTHKGYYVGTSTDHYHYYKAWIPQTAAIQGSETMYFKHKYITDPAVTPADQIVQAAKELTDLLKDKGTPLLVKSSTAPLKQPSNIFAKQSDKSKQASTQDQHSCILMHSPRVATTTGAPPVMASSKDADQHHNVIVVTAEDPPRVDCRVAAEPPPVPISQTQEQEKDCRVDAVEAVVVSIQPRQPPELPAWMNNYMRRSKDNSPADNMRSKCSISNEVTLTAIKMSNIKLSANQAAR